MASRALRRAAIVTSAWLVLSETIAGAELKEETARIYEHYRDDARTRFFDQSHTPGNPPPDEIAGRPAAEDGIMSIDGGLIHHWTGTAFIPNVTLQAALDLSRSYETYPSIYKEIIRSQVLERDGDVYRVLLRLKEKEAGISAVLDVRSSVRYELTDSTRAFSVSRSEEIREVRHAGTADEVLLPAGRDSGYLWRADVFTAFTKTPAGLYIETETLGLSRAFPSMLGWIIEPIARRFGRKSVVRSLEEFQSAAVSQM